MATDPDEVVDEILACDSDEITVCRGCFAELLELRRMVLDELPIIEDDHGYLPVNVKDLRPLQNLARSIRLCD